MQGMKCKTASVDYIFIYYFFRLKKKREIEPESEKKKNNNRRKESTVCCAHSSAHAQLALDVDRSANIDGWARGYDDWCRGGGGPREGEGLLWRRLG